MPSTVTQLVNGDAEMQAQAGWPRDPRSEPYAVPPRFHVWSNSGTRSKTLCPGRKHVISPSFPKPVHKHHLIQISGPLNAAERAGVECDHCHFCRGRGEGGHTGPTRKAVSASPSDLSQPSSHPTSTGTQAAPRKGGLLRSFTAWTWGYKERRQLDDATREGRPSP